MEAANEAVTQAPPRVGRRWTRFILPELRRPW